MGKKKYKKICSIDLGSSQIKIIEVENRVDEEGLVITNPTLYAYKNTGNDATFVDKVLNTLETFFTENDIDSKQCYISIPISEVYIRFVKLPPVSYSSSKIKKIIEYEALEYVPYDIKDSVIDYQLLKSDDGSLSVMFAFAKNNFLENLNKVFKKLHYNLDFIDLVPCAIYNIARANFVGKKESSIVISIGSKEISVVFVSPDSFFVHKIDLGGDDLTKNIALKMDLSFEKAEVIKKNYCKTDGKGLKKAKETLILKNQIDLFIEKIIGEINRSINFYRSERNGKKLKKIFLAGGSSVLPNITTIIEKKMRIPVSFMNGFQCFKIDASVDTEKLFKDAHLFLGSLGNALRAFYKCPVGISLKSKRMVFRKNFKNKIGYFLILYLILLAYPVVGYFDSNRSIISYKKKIDADQIDIKRKMFFYNKIKNKIASSDVIEDKLQKLNKLVNYRHNWLKILDIIEKNTPTGIWLSSFKTYIFTKNIAVNENELLNLDGKYKEKIEWQKSNKPSLKNNEIDKIIISGYSVYSISIADIKESLPEIFLKRLKEYSLDFIILDPNQSFIKNETILENSSNLTFFKIVLTLFNPLLGE